MNTDKGKRLFESISNGIKKEKMEFESIVRPNLVQPPPRSECREKFLEDYCRLGFYPAFKNNVEKKIPFIRQMKRYLKIIIRSKVASEKW